MMWATNSLCNLANEDFGTFAEYDPLSGYESDDYHISETIVWYIQESSYEDGSLTDLECDDVTIGMTFSPPLSTQEREGDASRRRAYDSHDEGLLSSQSLFVGHVRTGRPVEEFGSRISNVREIHVATQKMSKSGFFWKDKEQILADCQAEIRKQEFPIRP